MASSKPRISRALSAKTRSAGSGLPLKSLLLLLGAWGIGCYALFSMSNFAVMIGGIHLPFPNLFIPLMFVSFIAMVYCWKQVPVAQENQEDISPWTARFFFWVFMALAGYLRLFDIFHVGASVWADHYVHTSDIRALVDLQWRPLLFPQGQREPLFPYFTALLWHFADFMPGLGIMQLSNALIDLAAIWVFYLLGKEVGGRRLGVLLMGTGAISKLMIETTKDQVGADTCVIGGAVALLFTLRFLKKMDMKHAVEWGIALGFGAYTYVPMRPWMPALLGMVWIYILLDPKEKLDQLYRVILGPFLLACWAFLFVYKNGFITADHIWVKVMANPFIGTLCLLVVIFGYFAGYQAEKKKGFSKLFKWAVAAAVIRLVLLPLYESPDYANHVAGISIISANFYSSSQQSINSLILNLKDLLPLFFGPRGFPMCFPAGADSMYGFFETALGFLGLAYFVARPSLEKVLVIIMFFVGWVPGVLSNAPYPLRYLTSDVTLFLTGAWALNRLWVAGLQVKDTKVINSFIAALVLVCGLWQLSTNFNLYQKWMGNPGPNPLLDNLVQEELPTHRVYLVYYYNDSFWTVCQDLLSDQRQVYRALDNNNYDLAPEEKGKDLAIFVFARDTDARKKLEKEFPGIPWKITKIYFSNPNGEEFAYLMEVPFDRLKDDPKDFFYTRRAPSNAWLRRFYGSFGLGRGFIRYEDRVANWNQPVTVKQNDVTNGSQSVEGDFAAKAEGDYTFTLRTSNVYRFYLDGKPVFEVTRYDRDPKTKAVIHLTPGLHHVLVVNGCTVNQGIPPVMIQSPGAPQAVSLEDYVLGSPAGQTVPAVAAKK